jgi:secretion/DNA translocation related TadE-like protein
MVLGLVALLVFVAMVSMGAIAIVLAHRRAQVAADLAALAGAGALQRGADPCAAATRIVLRHRAELTSCVVDGRTVLVGTAVALPSTLGGAGLPARARAGPVPPG